MYTTLNNRSFIVAVWAGVFLLVATLLQDYTINLPNFSLNRTERSAAVTEPPATTYNEEAMIAAINSSLPSVVTIEISTTVDEVSPYYYPSDENREVKANIGSGFVVSNDGYIVTNKHVVSQENASFKVITSDEKKYEVEEIIENPENDLALIKVKANNLKAVPLGNSEDLQLGQQVVAIGTPFGEYANTVTSGIISGLGRGVTAGSFYGGEVEELNNVIQTDAAINLGNSGGPLINSQGEVVGVNTAVAAGGENIGFAIPVEEVKKLIKNAGI